MKKIEMFFDRLAPYAGLVMRCGIGFAFMWFGWAAITDTEAWVRLVPEWATAIAPASTLVLAHGIFELVAGFLLCAGYWSRTVAILLGLNLAHTALFLLPWGPNAVRDTALFVVTLGLGIFKDKDAR